jgi:branched-chain amino acid transport system ATP-binding protein
MLKIEGIDFSYGPVKALHEVSIEVGPGEIVCLLGANGAGKSTLLGLVSGLYVPSRGEVHLNGQRLSGLKPSAIVAAGVVQVPEGRQLFSELTVRENLELGAWVRRGGEKRHQVEADLQRMWELFPALVDRAQQAAGTLSGGEQQMVAMARGLMARPRVLLLDEPTLGLAPLITREIFRVIKRLPSQGTSVLLVEQNALGALSIAHRGYILTNGCIRFQGGVKEILGDQLLREAFLGPERVTSKGVEIADAHV